MKTLVKLLMIAILAIIPATTFAQQKKQPDPEKREAFAKAQAAEIAKKLELNDELTKKFTDTYLEYQKEMWSVGRPGFNRPKFADMTEDQAKEENKTRLDHQRKVLDIRTKFYEQYSKFLTQKQILRVNELEKRMFDRMMQKHNKRHGDNKGPKQPRGQRPDRQNHGLR